MATKADKVIFEGENIAGRMCRVREVGRDRFPERKANGRGGGWLAMPWDLMPVEAQMFRFQLASR